MQPHVPQSPVSPDSSTTSTRTNRIQPQGRLRCRSRNRKGTRCRLQCDAAIGRCPRHRLRPAVFTDDVDLSIHFTGKLEEFRSATQINDFLTVLIRLVVTNEISARRAAVIGYLTSQLRHTLPEIAAEQAPPEPRYIIDVPRPGCRSDADDQSAAIPEAPATPASVSAVAAASHADPRNASAPNPDPPTAMAPSSSDASPGLPATPIDPSVVVARLVHPEPGRRVVPACPAVPVLVNAAVRPEPRTPAPVQSADTARPPQRTNPDPHLHQPGFANPYLSGPPPNLDKLFPADPFSVPLPRRKTLRALPRQASQVSRLNSDDPFDWSPD
jgi:hypothetical protein